MQYSNLVKQALCTVLPLSMLPQRLRVQIVVKKEWVSTITASGCNHTSHKPLYGGLHMNMQCMTDLPCHCVHNGSKLKYLPPSQWGDSFLGQQ